MAGWPPRFLFVSGRLSLDFAQTGGEGKWAVWERWNEPGDLVDWLAQCSLGLKVRRVTALELESARSLRSVVWESAQCILRGRPLSSKLVRALERAAATADLVPVLRAGKVGWAASSTATQAFSSVARDAIALFGSDAKQRLRECRNPSCPLLFVDTSRPGKRAWCTMRRCGNLQKTARYRRNRNAPGASAGRRGKSRG